MIFLIILLVTAIVLFVLVTVNARVSQKAINLFLIGLVILMLAYNAGWFARVRID